MSANQRRCPPQPTSTNGQRLTAEANPSEQALAGWPAPKPLNGSARGGGNGNKLGGDEVSPRQERARATLSTSPPPVFTGRPRGGGGGKMIWGMAATAAAEPSVRPHNAGGESDSLARLHAEVRVGGRGGCRGDAGAGEGGGSGRDKTPTKCLQDFESYVIRIQSN